MPVTLERFAASGPALAADTRAATVDTVNAVALQLTNEARAAVKRVLGADSRLGKGKRKITVFFSKARANLPGDPRAVVQPLGAFHLIERPHKGGYKVTAPGKALRTPHGPFKTVTAGPELNPPAPITRTFARAQQIADQVAPAAFQKSMDQRMKATLEGPGRGAH